MNLYVHGQILNRLEVLINFLSWRVSPSTNSWFSFSYEANDALSEIGTPTPYTRRGPGLYLLQSQI